MSGSPTPAALVTLRTKVGEHFEAAVQRSPEAFACRRGCHDCCAPGLSVFGVEARQIRRALSELAAREPALRARIRDAADDGARERCCLLVDGACAVYDERPMLCRTHGLPLLVRTEAGPVVDQCFRNFVDAPAPRESVLDVARVDEPLALIAHLEGADERVDLRELAREAD